MQNELDVGLKVLKLFLHRIRCGNHNSVKEILNKFMQKSFDVETNAIVSLVLGYK